MQDLSFLAENSITSSSMAAGNMTSSNAVARTAPGSPPVDPLLDRAHQTDPTITAEAYVTPVLRDADGSQHTQDRANRTTPYRRADGSAWLSPADNAEAVPLQGNRSMLRRGGGWANRNVI